MVRWQRLCLVGVILLASTGATGAATVRTLYDFCSRNNCADGSGAMGGLLRDGNGNLYGTTTLGGAHGFGAVFELKRDGDTWTYQVLHSFCSSCGDGAFPQSKLVLDTAGNLYGTAPSNGELDCGIAFRLSPNGGKWKLTRLHSFCAFGGDGAHPVAGLTYAGAISGAPYDGVSPLYGVTLDGGANGLGAVYEIRPGGAHGKERVLYSFCPDKDSCSDGAAPLGDLLVDPTGSLLGNTFRGGAAGDGTVFRLSPRGGRWHEEVLHSFCSTGDCEDGSFPEGGLAMDAKGDLFGTTTGGGANGGGTLYRLAHRRGGWDETVLHSFCSGDCTDGSSPSTGPLIDSGGGLFGTTGVNGADGGTVYRLQGSTLTTLHDFCTTQDCLDGAGPLAPLILDDAGNLLGVTVIRGAHNGGTIFELSP